MCRLSLHLSLLITLLAMGSDSNARFSDSTRTTRWYVPHYIPVQFAGNIGFVSAGLGYTSNHENYQLSLLYGYVPSALGGASIHTVTAKNIFPLTRYLMSNNRTLIPYLGVGLTVEISGNTFFRQPDHYPKGYYDFPKNLHAIGYGGAMLRHLFPDDFRLFRGMELYAEAGTVDIYIWYRAMSSQIRLNQIFSLALGVNFLLDHK